jgi:anhydro-N-acetylmuramic acid kinase
MAAARLFAGLMSGTSLDGVDAVLLELGAQEGASPACLRVLGHVQLPMPPLLRAEFAALNQASPDELHRAQLAGIELSRLYALALEQLLRAAGVGAADLTAVGAHGQTVRHRPELGYTVQLGAPAWLAEQCGITVVADFRSRDLAAGGQGAPLVPAFHRAVFGRDGADLAVLNLGGIANLSLLYADGRVLGFDSGPGNALLDLWAQRHLGRDYDAGGAWGAGGAVLPELLERLLDDAYFRLAPPKSTGRDYFDAGWLQGRLRGFEAAEARDVQATLARMAAAAVAAELRRHMPDARELLVCGGGAGNLDLLRHLRQLLPGCELLDTRSRGLEPQQVEAAAFAWLAARTLDGLPGNLPAVTGARGPRVLGAVYPA